MKGKDNLEGDFVGDDAVDSDVDHESLGPNVLAPHLGAECVRVQDQPQSFADSASLDFSHRLAGLHQVPFATAAAAAAMQVHIVVGETLAPVVYCLLETEDTRQEITSSSVKKMKGESSSTYVFLLCAYIYCT